MTHFVLQISVDTSPPEIGKVHDGMMGSAEVDYQSDFNMNAYWDGFFDKESGVKFYKYIFATQCWNQDDWEAAIGHNVSFLHNTSKDLKKESPHMYEGS